MSETRVQFLRFAAVGVAGFAVDVLVLYLALRLGMGPYVSRVLSFLAAVRVTWELNRRFTFAGAASGQSRLTWWRYLLAMLGGGIANYAVYSALVALLRDRPWLPLLGVAAGSIAGLVINFSGARLIVFRRR